MTEKHSTVRKTKHSCIREGGGKRHIIIEERALDRQFTGIAAVAVFLQSSTESSRSEKFSLRLMIRSPVVLRISLDIDTPSPYVHPCVKSQRYTLICRKFPSGSVRLFAVLTANCGGFFAVKNRKKREKTAVLKPRLITAAKPTVNEADVSSTQKSS